MVVLGAPGGFEITVAAAISSTRLQLAIVNPRQVCDFARAHGRLAKTAALDAGVGERPPSGASRIAFWNLGPQDLPCRVD